MGHRLDEGGLDGRLEVGIVVEVLRAVAMRMGMRVGMLVVLRALGGQLLELLQRLGARRRCAGGWAVAPRRYRPRTALCGGHGGCCWAPGVRGALVFTPQTKRLQSQMAVLGDVAGWAIGAGACSKVRALAEYAVGRRGGCSARLSVERRCSSGCCGRMREVMAIAAVVVGDAAIGNALVLVAR